MASGGPADALIEDGAKLEVPGVAIRMIMLTMFIDTLAGSISSPIMPYYAKAFDVATKDIGWLYGLWSFSSTVFAPMLVRLADKVGRRPVLIMSLVGAGVANLIQGSALSFGAWGFSVFLFGRFFSGIWAAVGATCNVYITDVCPEAVRASYIAQMSTVPLVALLFGPGLGGGLSKFGLNMPVTVDGAITLVSACLVSYYLPETPSFLRNRRNKDFEAGPSQAPQKATPLSFEVYLLGFSMFLGGIGFSALLSSFGLAMLIRFGFDSLQVGFTFTGQSLIMVAANVWAVPWCAARMRLGQSVVLGGFLNGLGLLLFAFCEHIYPALLCLCLIFGSSALRGAGATAFVGSFSDETNRGKVFATAQTFANTGRMIGPIAATHLISWFGVGSAFTMSAVMIWSSASIVFIIDRRQAASKPAPQKPTMRKQETMFGDDWEDEYGSKEEVEELGRYVAELLSKRHYQWVSKKDQVRCWINHAIPELDTSQREAYKETFSSVFGRVEGRSICG